MKFRIVTLALLLVGMALAQYHLPVFWNDTTIVKNMPATAACTTMPMKSMIGNRALYFNQFTAGGTIDSAIVNVAVQYADFNGSWCTPIETLSSDIIATTPLDDTGRVLAVRFMYEWDVNVSLWTRFIFWGSTNNSDSTYLDSLYVLSYRNWD